MKVCVLSPTGLEHIRERDRKLTQHTNTLVNFLVIYQNAVTSDRAGGNHERARICQG